MIVKMKKITFIGLNSEKDRFISRLQEVGTTHITLPREAEEPAEIGLELQKVTDIRKFLSRFGSAQSEVPDPSADYAAVCSEREELGQKENRLLTEVGSLKKERTLLEPWGDFEPQDIALLRSKGVDVGFYRMPRSMFKDIPLDSTYCHMIRETAGEVAFLAISSKPVDWGVAEEKLPAKSLSEIDREIDRKNSELEHIKAQYEGLSKKVQALLDAEAELKDHYELSKVLLNTASALDERLFFLSCWSPVPEDELMKRIGGEFTLYHFSEDPKEEDKVPVLLSNKSTFDSGEDLVKVYSHPNYVDFDPSGLVLYFFALFYGMIIGDAGYGFILLGLTALLHWKIKSQSPLWIRFRRMSYLLSCSVILWGIISASYFGISLGAGNPLTKVMLINLATKAGQNQAMLISIIVGMVHISVALAIKSYRTRDLAALGWIIIIWSAYALIHSKMIEGVPDPIATYIMLGGFALVVLFTSSSRNPIIRILLGINGALGIVQIFADVLSYLRLFALGLATMYMCQTFNMLAGMPYKGIPYVGFLPAVLILICGHSINILLAIMGGVVHGLRLNFLEWYRWCFEGDGLPFKPFKKMAVQV